MKSTRLPLRVLGPSLALAGIVLGWTLLHQDSPDASAALAGAESGLTVRVDPEHGIVPLTRGATPVARDAIPSLGKSSAGVEIVEHPDGMRSAVLHEGFMSTSVARIDEDGTVVTDCLDSADEVEAFLAGDRDANGLEVR